MDWQVMGFGNFSGRGENDMILRNAGTGGMQVYDISNNQITGSAFLGTVGLNWQMAGVSSTIIASALLIATPATAGEFKRYPQPNGQPDHIAVSGRIQMNDERKFVELTADLKDATIILDSPGGNIWPSMRIGTVIRADQPRRRGLQLETATARRDS
jgi:hypothetical protein